MPGANEPDAPPAGDASPPDGIWFALALDGTGGARELEWDQVLTAQQPIWIHLDPRVPRAVDWIRNESGLPPRDADLLLRDEPRIRLEMPRDDAFLISLRGQAAEVEPESRDVAFVQAWVEPNRIITLSRQALAGVAYARELYRNATGPSDLRTLFVWMTAHLGSSLREAALDMEDDVTELEYAVANGREAGPDTLRDMSSRIARLRRHVAPFKILVARAISVADTWLIRDQLEQWRRLRDEAADTESLLQTLSERVRALQEDLQARLAARMNYVLYVLTILSMILVPMTFFTGLFGMNIGIKGASYRFLEGPLSFFLMFTALAILGWLEYALIKKLGLVGGKAERRSA